MRIAGRWRITEAELWDCDALNLVAPAFIEFAEDGSSGSFGFVEMPRPEEPRTRRQQSGLTQLITGRLQRGYPAGHMRNLSIGGRVLRVAVRGGNPAWPPLLLCNGIGPSLELLQPLVDALDPQWA